MDKTKDERFLADLKASDPGEYAAECVRRLWAAFETEHPGKRGLLHTADGEPAHYWIEVQDR